MDGSHPTHTPPHPPSNFRKFFFRGVAILLPSVLTIWILIAAYQFVQSYIAQPINTGIKELILRTTPWPYVTGEQISDHAEAVKSDPDKRQVYGNASSRGRGCNRIFVARS